MATFKKINFGDGLAVTDHGGGEITVAGGGAAGPEGPQGDPGPQGPAGEGVPVGGTAGQVLTKDTTTDYDTSWQTPADATTQKLADVTLAADTISIDIPSIPQTFAHLRLVCYVRLGGATSTAVLTLRMNGDAGGNYWCQRMKALGTTVAGEENPATVGLLFDAATLTLAPAIFELPCYRASSSKQALWSYGYPIQLAAGQIGLRSGYGLWNNTAAITRLTITSLGAALAAGSRATLYGLT